MKNLLVYINPEKEFDNHTKDIVKVQIDNSLEIGWDIKDILLVTNFEYQYNGIEALVVDDSIYCVHRKRASKINAICNLFDMGLIDGITWFHDIDAFQLHPIAEEELGLDGVDAGFTDYGPVPNSNWNTGSFFFKPESKDIFEWIRYKVYKHKTNEEAALFKLTQRNANNINDRIKKMNNTYNLCQKWNPELCYDGADKPIRVLHVHPGVPDRYRRIKELSPPYLIDIFAKHGYS